MKQKIELTEREIDVIKMQLDGKLELFTGQDDEMDIICDIVRRAESLMHELEAYEESGDDLVAWYWDKYQEQNANN